MAEFGIQATQLSAPTGAGSSVIQPVEASKPIGSGLLDKLEAVTEVFSKNMKENRKLEADKRQNTVVQGYIKEEAKINDALASGGLRPAEASARSRANFNQYAAGYGEYIGEFEKAGKALRGFTEMGEAEDELKTEKARKESVRTLAVNRGFSYYKGMSQAASDAQDESALTAVRVEAQLGAHYKASSEARAQAGFDNTVQDREDKRVAFDSINMVASSNITSFQALAKDLGDQARGGKISPDDAKARLNERFSNIQGAIAAAARLNPELASSFSKVFTDINNLGIQMMDPANDVKTLEDQLKKRILQSKLLATDDKVVLAGVVTNQLFGNSPTVALAINQTAQRALTNLSGLPIDAQGIATPVVGNPDAEPGVLLGLKQSLKDISTGNTTDKELAITQASNTANHILMQIGDVVDKRGASPKDLKGVAEFVASTEYVTALKTGKISPQAAGAANKAFQIMYTPTIVEGVQSRLDKEIPRKTVEGGVATAAQGKALTLGETVDIKFTGSGVVFEPKMKAGMSRTEIASAGAGVEGLRSSQAAVTQLIHIAAHLEGTTDYNKIWERDKHLWIPSVFPDPAKLQPGAVVDGYKYTGGAYNDRSSWVKQ